MLLSGVQQDAVSQSLDQEVLLKVKTEIEEELKSLDKEISEGLFILISWLISGSVGVVSFVFLQSSVHSIT